MTALQTKITHTAYYSYIYTVNIYIYIHYSLCFSVPLLVSDNLQNDWSDFRQLLYFIKTHVTLEDKLALFSVKKANSNINKYLGASIIKNLIFFCHKI